jgi:sugar lactone lactonase YvrE
VWDKRNQTLYFSDVPQNIVFKWQPGVGTKEFLNPSGYTGTTLTNGQGSNGLTFDKHGHLILCQHGDRRIARLEPKGGSAPSRSITNSAASTAPTTSPLSPMATSILPTRRTACRKALRIPTVSWPSVGSTA